LVVSFKEASVAPADAPPRTYDGYHLVFLLGVGLFLVCLVVGLGYSLAWRHRLPGIGFNLFAQADDMMARGESNRALQEYRTAARISPWDRDPATRLARALGSAGSPDAALAAWRSVIAIDSHSAEATLRLGQGLARAGRFEEAADRFAQTLVITPGNLDNILGLGDALLDQGQTAAAVEAYRRGLPRHASSAVLHNALGIAWTKAGRFDEAVVEFAAAATLSSDPTIAANLARARAEKLRGPS
jgi:Flp pilus assembly protein TadD